jgi:hypothetical protein
MNQVTKERRIEAKKAVQKLAISNPGIIFDVPQRRRTLIRSAVIPRVKIEMGRVMSWRTGLIKVFTIPMAIAAMIAVQILARWNPGTRYSTTKSATTLTRSLHMSFIFQF